jgi:hypothetical protein
MLLSLVLLPLVILGAPTSLSNAFPSTSDSVFPEYRRVSVGDEKHRVFDDVFPVPLPLISAKPILEPDFPLASKAAFLQHRKVSVGGEEDVERQNMDVDDDELILQFPPFPAVPDATPEVREAPLIRLRDGHIFMPITENTTTKDLYNEFNVGFDGGPSLFSLLPHDGDMSGFIERLSGESEGREWIMRLSIYVEVEVLIKANALKYSARLAKRYCALIDGLRAKEGETFYELSDRLIAKPTFSVKDRRREK